MVSWYLVSSNPGTRCDKIGITHGMLSRAMMAGRKAAGKGARPAQLVKCPMCSKLVPSPLINAHLDTECKAFKGSSDPAVRSRKERRAPSASSASGKIAHIFMPKGRIQRRLSGEFVGKRESLADVASAPLSAPPSATPPPPKPRHAEQSSTPSFLLPRKRPAQSAAPQLLEKRRRVNPSAPLADRMRPRSLEEFVGQDEVTGKDGIVRALIGSPRNPSGRSRPGYLPSLILWGPPGVGKTTIARMLAARCGHRCVEMSAAVSNSKDLREMVDKARNHKRLTGQQSVLFLDEIHRFNKLQQDLLLPHIESGLLVLIGATTQNPSFELNNALLSRTRVVTLKPLGPAAIRKILDRALADADCGLGRVDVRFAWPKGREGDNDNAATAPARKPRSQRSEKRAAKAQEATLKRETALKKEHALKQEHEQPDEETPRGPHLSILLCSVTGTRLGVTLVGATPATATVSDLKEAIHKQYNVPGNQQRLIYMGRELKEENLLLARYGVNDTDAVMHIVRRDAPSVSAFASAHNDPAAPPESDPKDTEAPGSAMPAPSPGDDSASVGSAEGRISASGRSAPPSPTFEFPRRGNSEGYRLQVDPVTGDIKLPDGCAAGGSGGAKDAALSLVASMCGGDARAALNILEFAVSLARGRSAPAGFDEEDQTPRKSLDEKRALSGTLSASEKRPIVFVSVDDVKSAAQRSSVYHDRRGESHYNLISALHKSVRGSDADAALYYLGRMLLGGAEPLYVARRLIRIASEDIGLADASALPLCVAAYNACHVVGMPECELALAQATAHLARAPKSVALYRAYKRVKEAVARDPNVPVPLHLCNAPTGLMKRLGYGKGYQYNPDFADRGENVTQTYLPDPISGLRFFTD